MTHAAPSLFKHVRRFPNWFHGFPVAVVDIEFVTHIIEVFALRHQAILNRLRSRTDVRPPIEVCLSNGEINFGEMIQCLVPERVMQDARKIRPLPVSLEFVAMHMYIVMSRFLFRKDPYVQRFAAFARLSLMRRNSELQRKHNHYLYVGTARDIRDMYASDNPYVVRDVIPDESSVLSLYSAVEGRMFVVDPKSRSEILQFIQQSRSEVWLS